MGKYYYETRHQYECKGAEEKPAVSESEVETEMREHPWADREIAEQIVSDHKRCLSESSNPNKRHRHTC